MNQPQPGGILSGSPLFNPDLRAVIISFFGPRDAYIALVSKSFEATYERCVNPAATAATGHRSPLRNASLKGHIFGYVGAGEGLFMELVSRGFKESYQSVEQGEVMSIVSEACDAEAITWSAHMTLMRAAVATAARFRWAVDCDLLRRSDGLPNASGSWELQLTAGQFGDVSTLQTAEFANVGYAVILGAALSGCIQKLQWVRDNLNRGALPDDISSYAARSGNVDMIEWLRGQGAAINSLTCAEAAGAGLIHMLEHLRTHGCEWDEETSAAAAKAGRTAALKWLREQGCPWDADTITEDATYSSTRGIDCLRYLKEQGCVFHEGTMAFAAESGFLEVCQYLRAEECPWDKDACDLAARNDKVDVLRWLRECDCPCTVPDVCIEAALGGAVNVLEYLYEQLPAPTLLAYSSNMLNAAGAIGKLDTAKWLRQRGADWPAVLSFEDTTGGGDEDDDEDEDEEVVTRVWAGESLAWAREQGCTSPTAVLTVEE
jgi:hypothetical protein